ncbi:Cys-rich protein [Leptospira yasudae]|uniref:Cys-rich protein n=1 Tax=Leptospira yasudae TaxID=2202201 RepID=A0A6N4QYT9_9LEPT|nr:Cys-rich protein [Leptospira yasudae]MBW0435091.1 Cys-rich protein [Leptospira yasudae]TGL78052.1 Cys-rich protein [Leptospira yasudae]TGL81336.1 Cys-rich protein [Leptospira yasudae]TGL81486.1 Cys-rich protein [Leptospira yasudae]
MNATLRHIVRYAPVYALLVLMISVVLVKYGRMVSKEEFYSSESKEICLTYCTKLTGCVTELFPGAVVQEQMGKIENSCLRGCRKHFDKMQVCLNGIETASCKSLTGCLQTEIQKYY